MSGLNLCFQKDFLIVCMGLLILLPHTAQSQERRTPAQQHIRAQLTPRYQAVISAELSGKVKLLTYREGESFRKGRKLVEFECAEKKARLNKARAEQTIMSKKLHASLRLQQLGSIGNHKVDIARANVSKAKAEVDYWQAIKNKCIITAPFSGRVAKHHVHEYEYVSEGDPLIKIVNDLNLEIDLIVPSNWQSWLKPGIGFNINIEETGGDYPAEVYIPGAEVNPDSQSFQLIGRIKGRFPELLPGMSGIVTFSPRP
jgi:membrane fusion protein, multidrug efflux system